MQALSNADYKLFQQIAQLKQPSLMKTMHTYLKKYYKDATMTRDFVYATGDIPVMVVAHMDTVFTQPPTDIYYDKEKAVMWSPQGLGADDRAGVFLIIKLIKAGFRPHILFTADEERGCLGATGFVALNKTPIADTKYIIQLDRCGTFDCVFYDCNNPDFVEYVESFGFLEAIGSFSDISEICPAWKIAGVNLSVGYDREHTVTEVLRTNAMMSTFKKVCTMLKAIDKAPYFEYIPTEWSKKYSFFSADVWDSWYDNELKECYKCHTPMMDYEMFPVEMLDGTEAHFCPDCIVDESIEWCSSCGAAYEVTKENHPMKCKACTKKALKGAAKVCLKT